MRHWLVILGGMLVWSAHFFALYAVASIFPGEAVTLWLVLAATLAALAANGLVFWKLTRPGKTDGFGRWIRQIGRAGVALSVVAVIWQSSPVILAVD